MAEVITGLPSAEYHARPEISKSGLDLVNLSPAHYWASRTTPRTETPAMRFGTAAHARILEPDTFAERYIIGPEGIDRRTKEGKAAWAAFELEAEERIVIKAEEAALLEAMAESVWAHPMARQLLNDGQAETSLFSELDGVAVKCRPDWWTSGAIMDLKTTERARPDLFAKSVAAYRYHVQAAFYSDIAATVDERPRFLFVAVEKAPPFAVAVVELDDDAMAAGRAVYRRDLANYAACLALNHWPAYASTVETITLPRWALEAP
jgi:exodeoxyribonuclease VIII